jgi:hypothetical protein
MFSEMSYHAWRFFTFKPNDQSYGHIHRIVCSNDLILCTRVHIGMANNVAYVCFYFLWTEISFSIFRVPKIRFFVKGLPYICFKIVPNQLSNTRTYVMHNWPNGWVSKAFNHISWKRQISADSVGSRSNLNCSCLIVCSLFFYKNHF